MVTIDGTVEFFKFGGDFGWVSFFIIMVTNWIFNSLGKHKWVPVFVKCLSFICVVCGMYMVLNGLYYVTEWDYSGWFDKIIGGVEDNTKVAVGGKRGFVLVILIILPIFSILIGIFSSLMFHQSYKDTDSIYRNQQLGK